MDPHFRWAKLRGKDRFYFLAAWTMDVAVSFALPALQSEPEPHPCVRQVNILFAKITVHGDAYERLYGEIAACADLLFDPHGKIKETSHILVAHFGLCQDRIGFLHRGADSCRTCL